MQKDFLHYIANEKLIKENQKVLLGLSGGIDSMVMASIFESTGIPHVYAHCNFMLRGKESEQDEQFIREYAQKRRIKCFIKRFDTALYAKNEGISIQMAARQLRFDWFEELLTKENIDLMATAHHQDDQLETFFLNLMRSTGIAGLHGILPKQGRLIHPMLFASRAKIKEYAQKNQVSYREDSSNKTLKYARNKVRHNILPQFEEIHPNFRYILNSNIRRLRETEKIYRTQVETTLQQMVTTKQGRPAIAIEALKASNAPATYLFEYLAAYQFKFSTVEDIIHSLDRTSGKLFHSPTHTILRDRDFLLLQENQTDIQHKNTSIKYDDIPGYIDQPIRLSFQFIPKTASFVIDKNPSIAFLDADELEWPLSLGHWKKGEYFFPLGMNQAKKISDFLIDEKVSVLEKQKTIVIRSARKVVWIAGKRVDNRFRIKDKTKSILKIKILED
ncbi:MAG: tRNA lysidine(34) synthetase TilS [Bacteroidota bacterium]